MGSNHYLYLYNSLEDVFESNHSEYFYNIFDWISDKSRKSCSGEQSYIIVPTRSAGHWLLQKYLSDRKLPVCGISVIELWQARRFLIDNLKILTNTIGNDILQFLIKNIVESKLNDLKANNISKDRFEEENDGNLNNLFANNESDFEALNLNNLFVNSKNILETLDTIAYAVSNVKSNNHGNSINLSDARKIICELITDKNNGFIFNEIYSRFVQKACNSDDYAGLKNDIDDESFNYFGAINSKINPSDNYIPPIWTPVIDDIILSSCKKLLDDSQIKSDIDIKKMNVCFFGLDANFLKYHKLINSIFLIANETITYTPSPKFINEISGSCEEKWINLLESFSKKNYEVFEFSKENDIKIKNIEDHFLLADSWASHTELIISRVVEFAKQESNNKKIALIFPRLGKSSYFIAKKLAHNKIIFKDNIGLNKYFKKENALAKHIVNFHKNNRDISYFIKIVEFLSRNEMLSWNTIEQVEVKKSIHRIFKKIQSRDTNSILQNFRLSDKNLLEKIENLYNNLGEFKYYSDFETHVDSLKKIFDNFEINNENLLNVISKCSEHIKLNKTFRLQKNDVENHTFNKENISKNIFLTLIDSILNGELDDRKFTSDSDNIYDGLSAVRDSSLKEKTPDIAQNNKNQYFNHTSLYANIVITTLPAAQCQQWDEVIFCDCNENYWESRNSENPYLTDDKIDRIKIKSPNILNSKETYWLEKTSFLNFVSNCNNIPTFIGYLDNENNDPEKPYWNISNNALLSAFELIKSDNYLHQDNNKQLNQRNLLKIISNKIWKYKDENKVKNDKNDTSNNSINKDSKIDHKYNLNLLKNISDYDHNLNSISWNSSELDYCYNYPLNFVLKKYFEANSIFDIKYLKNFNLFIGSILHKILSDSFKSTADFKRIMDDKYYFENLKNELKKLKDKFSDQIIPHIPYLSWLSFRCMTQVLQLIKKSGGSLESDRPADMELSSEIKFIEKLKLENNTNEFQDLYLTAKFDLIIKNKTPANTFLIIIDFKTRKNINITKSDLTKGKHLQFLAYREIAKKIFSNSLEKNSPDIYVISPYHQEAKIISNEILDNGIDILKQFATSQKSLIFNFDTNSLKYNEYSPMNFTKPLAF